MKRLIGLAVSALLLALLYAYVDIDALGQAMRAADPAWLAAGLLMVVPLTLMTAARLAVLIPGRPLGFGEANRLILAASTLNLFLPSKLGDIAKGHVLARRHKLDAGLSYSIVALEKALDMASLLTWGVVGIAVAARSHPDILLFLVPVAGLLAVLGLLISPLPVLREVLKLFGSAMPGKLKRAVASFSKGWDEVIGVFWRARWRAAGTIALSLAIWGLHLFQFWLFTKALHADIPLLENAAFATLAILVGLLPFTFAGVGTRDAALVFFYAPYLSAAQAAFLGILATLRYVLPAIGGVPFVADFAGISRRSRT